MEGGGKGKNKRGEDEVAGGDKRWREVWRVLLGAQATFFTGRLLAGCASGRRRRGTAISNLKLKFQRGKGESKTEQDGRMDKDCGIVAKTVGVV